MKVAVIPARGGSKRIPQKNLKKFLNRPVIEYSIEAAKKSEIFDRIIVSTDNEDIAALAKKNGAEVPFMRPASLADDHATTVAVLEHAVHWLTQNNSTPEFFCCIYPTAPTMQMQYLKEAFELLRQKQVGAVIPVTTFDYPILRALKITSKGNLEMFWPEHEQSRSNDLPVGYHDAGQFYWLKTAAFLKAKKIFLPDALPIVIPRNLVQDIDTLEDWERAEQIYRSQMRD